METEDRREGERERKREICTTRLNKVSKQHDFNKRIRPTVLKSSDSKIASSLRLTDMKVNGLC